MNDLVEFLRTHEEAFRSRNRLQSLYSDFRLQKTSNPDGYQANSQAWLRGLTAAARAGRLPPTTTTSERPSHVAFGSGEDLSRALNSTQWGRPLALGAVIQDALDKRDFVPLDDFLNSTKSVYAKTWIPSPWQLVSWGLKQVGVASLFGTSDKLSVGNFVVMANVEEAANAIIAKASQLDQSLTSRIFSRDLFESEFALVLDPTANTTDHPESALSSTDFTILLRYLSRDKPYLSFTSTTIKLKHPSETTPQPITQHDTDIANLRTLISALETQVNALTIRITTLDITAREAVAAKRTIQAKSALRSKKLAETTLHTRSATLSQLEETYTAIQSAADQVAIVSAMSASTAVLKSLHAEVGGTEGVEEVVDRLREEMENVDEVGRVINEANTGGQVDEEDVDEEFAAMEKVEREKREQEEVEKTKQKLAELEKVEGVREDKDKNEEGEMNKQFESTEQREVQMEGV
ncbi:hypothetical protein M438DRAFT_316647 [Aureobasidium pullulans EXF-150]|uniref:Snf7-domain-containing protein n=1 Tax=Aureobasidium pullulans EXF-150 TaxID=1043002 RepID=A0A074XIC8_AURPU|nr:uncharacterized protein M438DRAFT_316647 [Aureobasidium pullulans EXF-150]KEQ85255.1 hypothetical protein M438DRAFT_316647 [Aureobasidium pullulans EXF-150]